MKLSRLLLVVVMLLSPCLSFAEEAEKLETLELKKSFWYGRTYRVGNDKFKPIMGSFSFGAFKDDFKWQFKMGTEEHEMLTEAENKNKLGVLFSSAGGFCLGWGAASDDGSSMISAGAGLVILGIILAAPAGKYLDEAVRLRNIRVNGDKISFKF